MGIHAADNLSHLAYDSAEPFVKDHYDYDEYLVMEYVGGPANDMHHWRRVGNPYRYWQDARDEFIKLFVEQRRKVKLVGRVFN